MWMELKASPAFMYSPCAIVRSLGTSKYVFSTSHPSSPSSPPMSSLACG